MASSDVAVKTGTLAKDIDVAAFLSWTSTSKLTLDAFRTVAVKKSIAVAGQSAVTIIANDGGSGGQLLFDNKGNLAFWDTGSSLVINGNSYTFVTDINSLAANVTASPQGFYALANDYDASVDGVYTQSPVTTVLQGTFEGLGHTISNLTISTQGVLNTGFFAQVGSAGMVRDLRLSHGDITSNVTSNLNAALGSVGGENDGIVSKVNVTGSVFGTLNLSATAGGLVGTDRGAITNATTNVKIEINSDTADVGGVAGLVDGTNSPAEIINSVSSGAPQAQPKAASGDWLAKITLA